MCCDTKHGCPLLLELSQEQLWGQRLRSALLSRGVCRLGATSRHALGWLLPMVFPATSVVGS